MDIAQGPNAGVTTFKGYFVNGFKFHTLEYGINKQTMNSGVCVKGSCYNDFERDYYGMLIEILELTYYGAANKVILFKCGWYDTERGIRVHRDHGLVDVRYKS